MNKKLLAVAIAGAFAAPVAMADTSNVVIYGTVNMSVDSVDGGSTSAATQLVADTEITPGYGTYANTQAGVHANAENRFERVLAQTLANSAERRGRASSNNSFIGFKGTEDLGNGLSAIWQWEFAVAFDTQNAGDLATSDSQGGQSKRNTFAGLSSKTMGSLTFGLQDTPLKTSTGKLDVFGNTLGDYRTFIGGMGGSVRAQNSVLYVSPSLNGFTGRALYGFANEAGTNNATNNGGKDGKVWSLSGTYDNGPIFATAAYEKSTSTGAVQDVAGGGNTSSGSPVATPALLFGSGINFMFGITPDAITNSSIAGIGYTVPNGPSSKSFDAELKTTRLGFGYNFGAFKLGAAYERSKATVNVTDNDVIDLTGQSGTSTVKRHTWYLSGAYTMGNTVLKAAYGKASNFSGSGEAAWNVGSNTGASQWTIGADYNMSKRTSVYALYTQVRNQTNGFYSLAGGATGVAGVGLADEGQDPKAMSVGMRHSF